MSHLRAILGPAAVPMLAVAAAIIVVGVLRALRVPGPAMAAALGSALALALEFLLAGGILRLSTLPLSALGVVAMVVVVRQVIARGIRLAERAVAGPRGG